MTYLPGESVCSATFMKTQFNPKSTNTHTMRRKTITEKRLKDIKEVCPQIERAWGWKSASVCPHRCSHPNQYTEMSVSQSAWSVKCSENELTHTHTHTQHQTWSYVKKRHHPGRVSQKTVSVRFSLSFSSLLSQSPLLLLPLLSLPQTLSVALFLFCVVKTKIKY